MPTIEVISLGADKIFLDQESYEIAIIEETELRSHRSLFVNFLKDKTGVIVHIGSPCFINDKDSGFFAGEIINWDFNPGEIILPNFDNDETGADQDTIFIFEEKYMTEIKDIIEKSIINSLIEKALFLTDYQFGPSNPSFSKLKLTDFWKKHNCNGLNWNCLYEITI